MEQKNGYDRPVSVQNILKKFEKSQHYDKPSADLKPKFGSNGSNNKPNNGFAGNNTTNEEVESLADKLAAISAAAAIAATYSKPNLNNKKIRQRSRSETSSIKVGLPVNGTNELENIYGKILKKKPSNSFSAGSANSNDIINSNRQTGEGDHYHQLPCPVPVSSNFKSVTAGRSPDGDMGELHTNTVPKVGGGAAPPKKPPRTFAHDIYLEQKKCCGRQLTTNGGANESQIKVTNGKPPPPTKPSNLTYNSIPRRDRVPVCSGNGGKNNGRMKGPSPPLSPPPPLLSQVVGTTTTTTTTMNRPKTPPPQPPHPYAVTQAFHHDVGVTDTNTVPRVPKSHRNSSHNHHQAIIKRSASEEHIYDEPEGRERYHHRQGPAGRILGGLAFLKGKGSGNGNDNGNVNGHVKRMQLVDNEIYGVVAAAPATTKNSNKAACGEYTEPYSGVKKFPRHQQQQEMQQQEKQNPLHYMSTPVRMDRPIPLYNDATSKEKRQLSSGTVSSTSTNGSSTSNNGKEDALKKGVGIVRDVVNWSLACIGQQVASPPCNQ